LADWVLTTSSEDKPLKRSILIVRPFVRPFWLFRNINISSHARAIHMIPMDKTTLKSERLERIRHGWKDRDAAISLRFQVASNISPRGAEEQQPCRG
jgi:hypothetical protein